MNKPFYVGRKEELARIREALSSPRPEMMALVGRRRVGKTYLINSFFNYKFDFEITAIHTESAEQKLHSFTLKLRAYAQNNPIPEITNWIDAFEWLKVILKQKQAKKKKVIFIDELPWFDTPRSGFVEAFAHFWNDWASKNYVLVIVCGSATSWMTRNIVNNKGGLHNRLTRILHLKPFTLAETNQFLKANQVHLDAYQLSLIYMTFGGIPHYLQEIKKGWSAAQAINHLFFNPKSTLSNEFYNLYPSLFRNAKKYIAIIRALSKKWQGLTRKELLDALKLSDGGHISEKIEDLVISDFVLKIKPFAKHKKDIVYRLIDPYSLFYLKFVESEQFQDFLATAESPTWKAWSGYAFENTWFAHLDAIKYKLGIPALRTSISSYKLQGDREHEGLQIDLLIDRADQCINVCEAKFYNSSIKLDKTNSFQLRKRINLFKESSKTKKQIFLTLLTVHGVEQNQHSIGLIDQVLKIDQLLE